MKSKEAIQCGDILVLDDSGARPLNVDNSWHAVFIRGIGYKFKNKKLMQYGIESLPSIYGIAMHDSDGNDEYVQVIL